MVLSEFRISPLSLSVSLFVLRFFLASDSLEDSRVSWVEFGDAGVSDGGETELGARLCWQSCNFFFPYRYKVRIYDACQF